MRLLDIIPQSEIVNAIAPEELAAAMLQHMNHMRVNDLGYRNNRFHPRNYCSAESQHYTQNGQGACEEALSAAWMHLIVTGMIAPSLSGNDWCFLTQRACSIRTSADYEHFLKVSLYSRGSIHRWIEEATYAEFLRGDYETAVFKAFKTVEMFVRRACDLGNEVYGKDLVVKAFHAEHGILTDREEVASERESLLQLFLGAIGRFKNPSSHRELNLSDPAEAIEAIHFASLLMRIAWKRYLRREGVDDLDNEESA